MPLINFSGIASGIDTEALIKAQTDATRQTRITPLEDDVTELTDQNDKLDELKTKLGSLQTLLEGMSSLGGGAVAKQAASSDETIFAATAANGAVNGTYSVNVTTKAKNGVYTFADAYSDLSAVVNGSIVDGNPEVDRTLTYTIGLGGDQETVTIPLTSTMTVSDLIAEFNSESSLAVMSAVNVGTTTLPSYRLVVSSLNEGTAKGTITTSRGADLTGLGIFDSGTATTQAATNAVFDIAGVGTGITRSSNTINDVIPGATLRIADTGSGTLQISDDVAQTTNNLQDFVDLWNEIVTFVSENNLVTRQEDGGDTTNVFGALSKTRVDDGMLSSLRSALSSAVASTGTSVRVMADIGIKTERDGTLTFDKNGSDEPLGFNLEDALATESNSVNLLLQNFADSLARTGGVIDLQIGFNRSFDLALNSNKSRIDALNTRISEVEKRIANEEATLRSRYAKLEANIGRLQNQQGALTSAIAGLG